MFKKNLVKHLSLRLRFHLVVVLVLLCSLVLVAVSTSKTSYAEEAKSLVNQTQTTYTLEIGQKVTSRCGYIKDYLTKGFRINELASRQNRVRGWEYLLQSLTSLKKDYEKLNKDYSPLAEKVTSLQAQLEQFRKDFEAYDSKLQELITVNCQVAPELFWAKLNEVKSYRSAIALAVETFNGNLEAAIIQEEQTW